MIRNNPAAASRPVRFACSKVLFLLSATVSALILLWMHQMRRSGNVHGLSTIFFALFADYDFPAMVCALLVLGVALLGFPLLRARPILQWAGDRPVPLAFLYALVLALGTLIVYRNHPLAMDEYAAYFQSRTFAAGQLHGRFPAPLVDWLIPPGFQNYFLNVSRVTGNVAETYWPGFALLLAPFTWAGVPWICNPVISALTLLVIHRLALELFDDREAAGLALLLTIASPVTFANGISYYSMPAHLLTNSVFALLLARPTAGRAAVAGVVGSLALTLHNPVPHVLFAAPWLIWLIARPRGLRLLPALIAGYLPLCVGLGLGWFLFSGHLLREGLVPAAQPFAPMHRLQQMIEIFSIPNGTVVLARLIGIAKIWAWAVPGLMVLAAVGAVRWRYDPVCRLLTASALLTLIGYFFVPVDQGHGWGYRYFHSAWMTLPLLATGALFRPVQFRRENTPARLFEDVGTKNFVVACIMLTMVFGLGFRGWQLRDFIARDLIQVPQYEGTERRIVIIDNRFSFYGADLVQNDPWLRGNETRMISHGANKDEQMLAQYYPELHKVYSDRYGTVWSRALVPSDTPDPFLHRNREEAASQY